MREGGSVAEVEGVEERGAGVAPPTGGSREEEGGEDGGGRE